MDKLKPCPFCGGEAEILCVPNYFKQGLSLTGWLVKCLNGCVNQAPRHSVHDAIVAWNMRVEDKDDDWIPLTKDTKPPYWTLVWVTDKRGKVNICQLSHEERYWYDAEEEWMYEYDSIVAWMPYHEPEPYRKEGEE